jgi:hypothetical protein
VLVPQPDSRLDHDLKGALALVAMASTALLHGSRCFGDGYTDRAIVADVHPTHQPANTGKILRSFSVSPSATNAERMAVQTVAQPML